MFLNSLRSVLFSFDNGSYSISDLLNKCYTFHIDQSEYCLGCGDKRKMNEEFEILSLICFFF